MTDFVLLFSRDPLKNTDADVTLIIQKFREMRINFNSGMKSAGSTTPKKLTKAEEVVKKSGLKLDLDLGDLK